MNKKINSDKISEQSEGGSLTCVPVQKFIVILDFYPSLGGGDIVLVGSNLIFIFIEVFIEVCLRKFVHKGPTGVVVYERLSDLNHYSTANLFNFLNHKDQLSNISCLQQVHHCLFLLL